MREILFRAKTELECDVVTGETVKNPKWVYGYVDLRYMHNGFGVVIIDEKVNKTYLCQYRTIGQYTGSPDRNEKKKIFEGDICQFYDDDGESSLYVVIWEGFGWKVKDVCSGMMDDLNEFFCKRCEVIGNVFDNPELLKEGVEMSELKPCPFCGGEAQTNEVVGMSNGNPPFGWGWVGCQKCRVFMQYNHGERGKRQAVEAWNRRADEQQPGAASANDRQIAGK